MDYGKMAYLKVEDLSGRVARVERSTAAQFGALTLVTPKARALDGAETVETLPFRVTAAGGVTAIVRVRLALDVAASGTIAVLANGVIVQEETLSFPIGNQDYFTFCFFQAGNEIDAFVEIRVSGLTGTLLRASVILFGTGVTAADQSNHTLVALGGTALYLADGHICYVTAEAETAVVAQAADAFGAAQHGTQICVVYVKDEILYFDTLGGDAPVTVDDHVSSAALCADANGYSVAYIKDGVPLVRTVSRDLLGAADRPMFPKERFTHVHAVTNGAPAFLFRMWDGRVYLKLALPSHAVARTLTVERSVE